MSIPHILMVTAENDALPGGKVGGIGDVVRDVPPALAAQGCRVTVITPAYGHFATLADSRRQSTLDVSFAGSRHYVDLVEVPGRRSHEGVRHWVADHPALAPCGAGRIYCDDPPASPFARDASKFALFCAAVAEGLRRGAFGEVTVIHLHDWHAALLLALRRFHPAYRALQDIRCVFTVHNLALQGVRPLRGHASSLEAWYPGLPYDPATVQDPRWPDCVNPMAMGIRLAEAVHAVSPTYAREILQPSAVEERGYYGGEGLEGDLQRAREQGRLFGILNGCEYPEQAPPALDWAGLRTMLRDQVLRWAGMDMFLRSAHFLAFNRLGALRKPPQVILTSVSRITDQKVRLLRQSDERGRLALEGVLEALGDDGVYLFLGSGDEAFEAYLTRTCGHHSNFVFLRGYSDAVSQALYASGDLFLMPSSFEPCGISQMLAMRAGQPCLVHHVGGLKDTVADGIDGFAFSGTNLGDQASRFVRATAQALELRQHNPRRWQEIAQAARRARFSWDDSVAAYRHQLYRLD